MQLSQNMNELTEWIRNNLQYSRGLICKKCKREWFEKYKYLHLWQEIHTTTSFLDTLNPTFPQRIWHIVNNQLLIKCANPKCNNIPKFWSFNEGYLRACSTSCAQLDPITQEKIKSTNLKKYGTDYGLQNVDVKAKRKTTLMEKFGVDNISNVTGISDKKRQTCLKNYGTQWFLERTDLIKKYVEQKYGVSNVQKSSIISQRTASTRRCDFYDTLSTTLRLNNKCVPLFTKNEYINGGIDIKYLFKCNVCNANFLGWIHDGDIPRCTNCFKGSSIFEKEITDYVKMLLPSVDVLENIKSVISNNKELDIYIPSKNIAIECNGLFWHGELGGNKTKLYHLNKTIECESKGIRLIHIFEDEWIVSSNIIKNKLKHILGVNNNEQVYARKCIIKEVTSDNKNIFLLNNHIQGIDKSNIKLGLYYNNELVSIMTFGNKRIFTNAVSVVGEYELIRYATSIPVIGGASKLLSYFIKTYNPTKIISYADRRWSNGNLYEKIGFTKVSDGNPNYWYFGRDGNYRRFHRFGFAKHTLPKKLASFDPNISEWENMKNNGWDRTWDCGNLKYEMKIS